MPSGYCVLSIVIVLLSSVVVVTSVITPVFSSLIISDVPGACVGAGEASVPGSFVPSGAALADGCADGTVLAAGVLSGALLASGAGVACCPGTTYGG